MSEQACGWIKRALNELSEHGQWTNIASDQDNGWKERKEWADWVVKLPDSHMYTIPKSNCQLSLEKSNGRISTSESRIATMHATRENFKKECSHTRWTCMILSLPPLSFLLHHHRWYLWDSPIQGTLVCSLRLSSHILPCRIHMHLKWIVITCKCTCTLRYVKLFQKVWFVHKWKSLKEGKNRRCKLKRKCIENYSCCQFFTIQYNINFRIFTIFS